MSGEPSPASMKRAGFTLIEMLLVLAIIAVIGGVAAPLYRDYQIRNDLNVATEQVTQGLARARLLSQAAKNDTGWGFYIPAGVLYRGSSYVGRNRTFDETYAMPSTIKVTGLLEVAYSKVKGQPSATGAITLTAIDNQQRTILIQVQQQNIAVVQGDNLTICHKPGTSEMQTMMIPDSAWQGHQGHGDTLGPCTGSSSSASSVSSSASSATSAGTSSAATCTDRFSVASDGTITTTGTLNVIFQSLGAQFGYGNGGPDVPVYVLYSKKANGNSAKNLFGGAPINGTGGAIQTVTGFVNNDKVILKFHAYYSNNGWLTYDKTVSSNDTTGSVKILRNGDIAPTIAGSNGQRSVSTLLAPVTVNGRISIGQYDLLMLADFNYQDCHTCDSADFQDGIVLVKFQSPSC